MTVGRCLMAVTVGLTGLGACRPAPEYLPALPPVLRVTLREYRFDYTPMVPRGRVVVRVHNAGRVPHELILLALSSGSPPLTEIFKPGGEKTTLQNLAILPPLAPEGDGVFAVDLKPGRYGFVCLVSDSDGVQHDHKGMLSDFQVR